MAMPFSIGIHQSRKFRKKFRNFTRENDIDFKGKGGQGEQGLKILYQYLNESGDENRKSEINKPNTDAKIDSQTNH